MGSNEGTDHPTGPARSYAPEGYGRAGLVKGFSPESFEGLEGKGGSNNDVAIQILVNLVNTLKDDLANKRSGSGDRESEFWGKRS